MCIWLRRIALSMAVGGGLCLPFGPALGGTTPESLWWGEARLTIQGEAPDDLFGQGGAIDGDWAAIGAPGRNTGLGNNTGAVNFFQRVGNAWVDRGLVVPNGLSAGDSLGRDVALDYPIAVASATSTAVGGDVVGGIYVFEHFDGNWETFQILPPVLAEAVSFGSSVAVHGDRIAVADFATDSFTGRVHVYRRQGLSSWTHEQTLIPGDATADDVIGQDWSLALGPDRLVMGGAGHEAAGNFAGAAWAFEYNGSSWVETQKLLPSSFNGGGLNLGRFGRSLDMDGDDLVIGSTQSTAGTTAGSGLIYVYRHDGSSWQLQARLINSTANTVIGQQVRISGDRIISDPGNNGGDPTQVFDRSSGPWAFVALLDDSTPSFDVFELDPPLQNRGQIDISGDHILIGSYNDDQNRGSSHVFDWRVNARSEIVSISPSPADVGQSVTITAQVSSASQTVQNGFVTIRDADSGGFLCVGLPVNGSGQASCTRSFPVARTWNLDALYQPQNTFSNDLSAAVALEVLPAPTITQIISTSPNPSLVGQPVQVGFTVAEPLRAASGGLAGDPPPVPTGEVVVSDGVDQCQFTLSTPDQGSGSCALVLRTAGQRSLTASYAGDALYAASVSSSVIQTVEAPLLISAQPATILTAQSSTLSVSGGSGSYELALSEGASFCQLTGNQVTGLAAGECQVTATSLPVEERGEAQSASVVIRVVDASGVDLEILIAPAQIEERGAGSVPAGGCNPVRFEILVNHRGTDVAAQVRLQAPVPRGLLAPVSWTCMAPAGSCTPASGSDGVDVEFALAVGETSVVDLQGCADPNAAWIELEAAASLPDGTPLLFPESAAGRLYAPINGDGLFRDRFD
ncbi:Ig-like domain repeat protein [Wenzhouxiangella marina]|uniref:Bacterial Ig-like domain-containing protein n=1 Tax=Wenzhouxiangella marina TaxID=1579979 RepID=A0A0K0XZN7_9GAMM|nr:Ig-like domain repeat protein [Wenzhouxiangella marina]AKS43086.1 hypothetical protein WM2015_2728 [Wenzhouxiangella marina]MBB6087230.1 hypothetical protein [Wenzhouxiangella marina]